MSKSLYGLIPRARVWLVVHWDQGINWMRMLVELVSYVIILDIDNSYRTKNMHEILLNQAIYDLLICSHFKKDKNCNNRNRIPYRGTRWFFFIFLCDLIKIPCTSFYKILKDSTLFLFVLLKLFPGSN